MSIWMCWRSDNGEDMLYLYWARAMDTTDPEDTKCSNWPRWRQGRTERIRGARQDQYHRSRVIPWFGQALFGYQLRRSWNRVRSSSPRNGKYEAEMQGDGNFVIYAENRQAIWATSTNGKGSPPTSWRCRQTATWSCMDPRAAIWASGVRRRTAPYTLIMQDDGNLVIYDNRSCDLGERYEALTFLPDGGPPGPPSGSSPTQINRT